jgi:hypothetical protein
LLCCLQENKNKIEAMKKRRLLIIIRMKKV